MNLTMGNLEVNTGDLLGAGGFGRVYRGRNKTTGEILAVKEIDCSRVAREKVLLEIKLMEFINGHPSFIGLRAAQEVTDTASIYIFMELAAGGELFERVIRDGKLTEQEATRYFSQIMSGVEQLHGPAGHTHAREGVVALPEQLRLAEQLDVPRLRGDAGVRGKIINFHRESITKKRIAIKFRLHPNVCSLI